MSGIKICGAGAYVPPLVVSNEDFTKFIDTSDEWIYTRTGIKNRHLAVGESNFFMATSAAKEAIENANMNSLDIDFIISSTCTPDFFYPSLSCLLQHELGAQNAGTVDVNNACTGFISAVELAQALLSASTYKTILVVASELLTPHVDYTDRASCVLFGDGAGAVVLQKSDKLFASFMGAKGDSLEKLSLYRKVNKVINCPFNAGVKTEESAPLKDNYLAMDGQAVYKFAIDAMPYAVSKALAKVSKTIEDIDLMIPHQANLRIIEKATKAMGIPSEKVFINIEEHGNTSSSCIPICLSELWYAGKIKEGMTICLVGVGAGLSYGAAIFEI